MQSPTLELKNSIVKAGAGAGKTTDLVRRVSELALHWKKAHGKFPRLVVTTYTRKATQELRERLLSQAMTMESHELLEFVSSKSQLHISTIHGVLSVFLSRYAHLAEFDNSFTIIAGDMVRRLIRKSLRRLILQSPQKEQLLALYPFSRWTAIANQYYACWLENPNLRPHSLDDFEGVFIQEVEAASKELRSLAEDIYRETNHEKYREYALALVNLSESMKGLAPEGFQESFNECVLSLPRKPPFSAKQMYISEELNERLGGIKKIKENFSSALYKYSFWQEAIEKSKMAESLLKDFCQDFFDYKKLNGSFEIRDLELMTLKILREVPVLGEAFASDWDYWFVDEYQDTSPLQVELLKRLMGQRCAHTVGDPQQSIYLFRGARSEVFRNKQNEIADKGGEVLESMVNYRSEKPLLHFINNFFQHVDPSSFSAMSPNSNPGPWFGCQAYFYHADVQENATGAQKRDLENNAIARHIAFLYGEHKVAFENICVIARTNKDLVEIAASLQKSSIPVHVHASSGFFQRREILDIQSILKFLINPHNKRNLVELLRAPYFRISDEDIFALCRECEQYSLWNFWNETKPQIASEVRESLQKLLDLRDSQGVVAALEYCVQYHGLIDFSHQHDPTGRRESNFWKYLDQIRQRERQPGFSWVQFISREEETQESFDSQMEADAVAALEPNCVNLMTVHASKGLAFEHVILARCAGRPQLSKSKLFSFDEEKCTWGLLHVDEDNEMQGCLPDKVVLSRQRQLEEQEMKRLLYVAVTRARKSVAFLWSGEPQKQSWAEYFSPWVISTELKSSADYKIQINLVDVLEPISLPKPFERASVRLAYQSKADPSFGHLSVTQLLEKKQSKIKLKTAKDFDFKAASEGVLFHRVMEALHYSGQEGALKAIPLWFESNKAQVTAAMNYVLKLKTPPMAELIAKGFVEWGFQMTIAEGILEGQIDLWGEVGGEVWVVDYKTGSVAYLEKAFQQLELYAQALKAYGVKGKIRQAVLFPFTQRCEIR